MSRTELSRPELSRPEPGRVAPGHTDTGAATDLETYNRAALSSAATVIGRYSTSFGLAVRLLEPRIRSQVRSIYALVRIADEIVDGAAGGAGVDLDAQRELLDALERETVQAIARGYSTNLVVHAFAMTARQTGIDSALIAPFFASMRRDLDPEPFTQEGVTEYIYGSAEVVGLMCLRSFVQECPPPPHQLRRLEAGASRLGAAFQKLNFLRDLADDSANLGRNYFPGIDPAEITEEQKNALLDDIDDDLRAAARTLPLLPDGCRTAVAAAHGLFANLAARLRETPACDLLAARVRVPNLRKVGLVLDALMRSGRPLGKRTGKQRR